MLKRIHLAHRKAGVGFDEFVRRWRMHGARGMAQPLWRHALGYVRAEPIRPAPIVGASEAFDAVAGFAIRDEMFADFTERDAAGASVMAADELETFAAPIPTISLRGRGGDSRGRGVGSAAPLAVRKAVFHHPARARSRLRADRRMHA